MPKRVTSPPVNSTLSDDFLFGYSVLMVDDQVERCDFVEEFFQSLGGKVVSTSDPFKAFEITKEWTPDLAIVDYMLPFMDGLELVEKWRDNQRAIKVIIASGREKSAPIGLKAGQLGVAAYLTWPMHARHLAYEAKRVILFGKPLITPPAFYQNPETADMLREAIVELLSNQDIKKESRVADRLKKIEEELTKRTPDHGLIRNLIGGIGRVSEGIAVKIGPELFKSFFF